ncbi:sugar ABC transporter substrate-binding protein [Acidimangrovimonas pyrenivorans]|uniref:Sugar ABC transporter substrate-binding protein n=1 Tax=Acidimangrovimonas pyrenivorans TaxID=2030798 RepID=A0ABV7AGV3_9RHOB
MPFTQPHTPQTAAGPRTRRRRSAARLLTTAAVALGLGAGVAAAQGLTATSFSADFSAMAQLKAVAAKGQGKIGILLPETTTSARYTSFDAPYLKQAFKAAGLSPDQFIITNAQGSESSELTQAQSDISQGATVLVMDPISSGVGASIETYAKQHGVPVIDYDRLTLGGSRGYYVSFDNVAVGKLIGQGMEQCLKDWKVKSPQILVMRGAPTDNNATLFAKGYMDVLKPKFASGAYKNVGEPAGTWDPAKARTTFEEQFTAHPDMNAAVVPNDDNANAVISYLKTLKVPPHSFPTTGQDATLTGMQNVLTGYQCGSVYKPIYLEAQAAAALALYLRAGEAPPAGLVNGKTMDSQAKTEVPSVLLKPLWVTQKNMAATVVADGFVPAKKLCAGGTMAKACKAAGINPAMGS